MFSLFLFIKITQQVEQKNQPVENQPKVTVQKPKLSTADQKFNRDLLLKQYKLSNEIDKLEFKIEDMQEELQSKIVEMKALNLSKTQVYSENKSSFDIIRECNEKIKKLNDQIKEIQDKKSKISIQIDKQKQLFKGFNADTVEKQIEQYQYDIDHSSLTTQQERDIRKKIDQLQQARSQTTDYKANQMQVQKFNEQLGKLYEQLKVEINKKNEEKKQLNEFTESESLTENQQAVEKLRKQIEEAREAKKQMIQQKNQLYTQFKK